MRNFLSRFVKLSQKIKMTQQPQPHLSGSNRALSFNNKNFNFYLRLNILIILIIKLPQSLCLVTLYMII